MKKKYLVTGFSGFVSWYFLKYLENIKEKAFVLGIDLNAPAFNFNSFEYVSCEFIEIDLLDKKQVDNILFQFKPDFILHLASFSSVAYSWKNPVSSFTNNTNIFLNLLEQVRLIGLKCRILSVGSSEEYGNASLEEMPLTEMHSLKPLSPYAVARVSQEMLSEIYVNGFGLDIVLTRSFNHIGAGQKDIFVVSSFAKQLVNIKANKLPAQIVAGDLSVVRDFLDVRDVVKAYHMLLYNGKKGEIYNVCSGKGIKLSEVIDIMAGQLKINIETIVDQSLIRPNDNKVIIGSNKKIREDIGWKNVYEIQDSLGDILNYWSDKL